MSEHCPQDGGFIGECGCTHPNHQHSELVKGLLAADKEPAEISVDDFDAAIAEGFYVDSPSARVGFGKPILNDWENGKHDPKDIENRKKRLAFAIATVREPDCTEENHRGYEGRTAYAKIRDYPALQSTRRLRRRFRPPFVLFRQFSCISWLNEKPLLTESLSNLKCRFSR